MKFFNIAFFALLSCSSLFSWVAVPGPLQLEDTFSQSEKVVDRGLIMKKVFSDTRLHSGLQVLMAFEGVTCKDQLPSYQEIMDHLSQSRSKSNFNQVEIDQIVELFEHAIMYCYDDCIYLVGGYTKYISIVVSGLRWRALNPFSYLNPFSWLSENHEKGLQIIYEFDQLASLSEKNCSLALARRLHATVFNYKHWFKMRGLTFLLAVMG